MVYNVSFAVYSYGPHAFWRCICIILTLEFDSFSYCTRQGWDRTLRKRNQTYHQSSAEKIGVQMTILPNLVLRDLHWWLSAFQMHPFEITTASDSLILAVNVGQTDREGPYSQRKIRWRGKSSTNFVEFYSEAVLYVKFGYLKNRMLDNTTNLFLNFILMTLFSLKLISWCIGNRKFVRTATVLRSEAT